jgi:hypothetical protein
MKRFATVLFAAALLSHALGCDGVDARRVAYDSLGQEDKACLAVSWRFAPLEEGRVRFVDGRPVFISNGERLFSGTDPDAGTGIWTHDGVVLREGQTMTMVCFDDCTEWAWSLGPNCLFVDTAAATVVGNVMRV